MPQNPPEGFARFTPYLLYEDLEAAIEWLGTAFGFDEQLRVTGPDGGATHAELHLDDGVVLMGHPGPDYRSPKQVGASCQSVYVYVDDVDAHHRQAKEAGATIFEEPNEVPYGDRRYGASDPEGQVWFFAQHVRDVPPEDYGATTA